MAAQALLQIRWNFLPSLEDSLGWARLSSMRTGVPEKTSDIANKMNEIHVWATRTQKYGIHSDKPFRMRWSSRLYKTTNTSLWRGWWAQLVPRNHSLSVSSPIEGEYNHTLVWKAVNTISRYSGSPTTPDFEWLNLHIFHINPTNANQTLDVSPMEGRTSIFSKMESKVVQQNVTTSWWVHCFFGIPSATNS